MNVSGNLNQQLIKSIEPMKKTMCQYRAEATLQEMNKQLKELKKDITFREYIGCELCINIFKKIYKQYL